MFEVCLHLEFLRSFLCGFERSGTAWLWMLSLSHCSMCDVVCHACDNQSHPRPKDSPSRLVPLPSSVRVPTTQPRTPQGLARMNTAARDQPCSQPCSPRLAPQHSPPEELAIATSLYLFPFHLCTLLFSFSAYRCPVPALYLSLYPLRLVV